MMLNADGDDDAEMTQLDRAHTLETKRTSLVQLQLQRAQMLLQLQQLQSQLHSPGAAAPHYPRASPVTAAVTQTIHNTMSQPVTTTLPPAATTTTTSTVPENKNPDLANHPATATDDNANDEPAEHALRVEGWRRAVALRSDMEPHLTSCSLQEMAGRLDLSFSSFRRWYKRGSSSLSHSDQTTALSAHLVAKINDSVARYLQRSERGAARPTARKTAKRKPRRKATDNDDDDDSSASRLVPLRKRAYISERADDTPALRPAGDARNTPRVAPTATEPSPSSTHATTGLSEQWRALKQAVVQDPSKDVEGDGVYKARVGDPPLSSTKEEYCRALYLLTTFWTLSAEDPSELQAFQPQTLKAWLHNMLCFADARDKLKSVSTSSLSRWANPRCYLDETTDTKVVDEYVSRTGLSGQYMRRINELVLAHLRAQLEYRDTWWASHLPGEPAASSPHLDEEKAKPQQQQQQPSDHTLPALVNPSDTKLSPYTSTGSATAFFQLEEES